MKLSPEDLDKLQVKQVANVIRKLNAGKTLTAREEALLAQARTGGSAEAPSAFAATWDELAQRLGVSRKSIQNWRDRPDLAGKLPRPRADGRHDVVAWSQAMVDHGLARADEEVESQELPAAGVVMPPPIGGSQADWNKATTHVLYEKKRDELQVFRGTLLVATELEVPLGAAFAVIQTKLSQFPARVARFVKGLRDEQEVEERLRDEIDGDLRDLHATRYVETSIEETVASLPFDKETERLLGIVTFDGQDRGALMQLIALVATNALRLIGRGAIQRAVRETEIPDTAIADEKTGQVTDEAAAREGARRQSPAPEKPVDPPNAGRKKKRRPKVEPPPPEIEASIHPAPRRKKRRKR